MRRLRRLLLAFLLVLGTLMAGTWVYLSSGLATGRVAARLQAAYGAPLALNNADIGWRTSELQGLQLFEAGPDAPTEPWAVANGVGAELPLWDVIWGKTSPEGVVLRGASVTLRFDADGKLLTQFPRPQSAPDGVGKIDLRDGTVTLCQDGHPPLVVTNVDLEVSREGDLVVASGTARKGSWGVWVVGATWNRVTNETVLTMKTPKNQPVEFTLADLRELPFVSEKVWKEVDISGATTVDLTMRRTHQSHYRIVLDVTRASVRIPSIDLDAIDVSGHVLLQDRYTRLENVRGKSADGEVQTEGELYFPKYSAPAQLASSLCGLAGGSPLDAASSLCRGRMGDILCFQVHVKGVKLKGLPASWFRKNAEAQNLDGKLTGDANLSIEIRNGIAHTEGKGKGVLEMFPLKIPLSLVARGKEFDFKFRLGTGISLHRPEADSGLITAIPQK